VYEEFKGVEMPTAPEACDLVLATLRRIIRTIDLHSKGLAKSYGLTVPQLLILRQLETSGGLAAGELARRVSLSQPTVSGILDRLAARELVARTRSVADRRQVLVTITPRATELLQRVPPPLQESFSRQFAELESWEQTGILSVLQRVAKLMAAEEVDASPLLTTGPVEASAAEICRFHGPALAEELPLLPDESQRGPAPTRPADPTPGVPAGPSHDRPAVSPVPGLGGEPG